MYSNNILYCENSASFYPSIDLCVSTSEFTSDQYNQIYKLKFSNFDTSSVVNKDIVSSYMKNYFPKSYIGCNNFNDITSCQILTNLCVQLHYDETSLACQLQKSITAYPTTTSTK